MGLKEEERQDVFKISNKFHLNKKINKTALLISNIKTNLKTASKKKIDKLHKKTSFNILNKKNLLKEIYLKFYLKMSNKKFNTLNKKNLLKKFYFKIKNKKPKKLYTKTVNKYKNTYKKLINYFDFVQLKEKERKIKYQLPLNLQYNRILYWRKLYNKGNKLFYYSIDSDILKVLKKKKKKKKNLKKFLWNSLVLKNFIYHNMYMLSNIKQLDVQFNLLPEVYHNYYKLKKNKKRKVFYTIFKNISNRLKNYCYKVTFDNKFYSNYKVHKRDRLYNMLINARDVTYYNQYFNINKFFILNYFYNFYNKIQFNLLGKFILMLKLFNYINITTLLGIQMNNIELRSVFYANIVSKNNVESVIPKIKPLHKHTLKWTRSLMRRKKWRSTSYFWDMHSFLKKIVLRNTKLNLNIFINNKYFIRNYPESNIKKYNVNVNVNSKYKGSYEMLKSNLPQKKLSKYSIYFLKFLSFFNNLKKNLLKQNHLYNNFLLSKYKFLLIFIKDYLVKLYYCFQSIFLYNSNKYLLYLLKLKIIIYNIYYQTILSYKYNLKNCKKYRTYFYRFKKYNDKKTYRKTLKAIFVCGLTSYYRRKTKLDKKWELNNIPVVEPATDVQVPYFHKPKKTIKKTHFIYKPFKPRYDAETEKAKREALRQREISVMKRTLNWARRHLKWYFFHYLKDKYKYKHHKFNKKVKSIKKFNA